MGFDLNAKVEVECPGCKEKFKVNLSVLKPGQEVTCPGCSNTIKITGDDVPGKIQGMLDDFKKSFGR